MADAEGFKFNEETSGRAAAHTRAVGSPLPRGGAHRASFAGVEQVSEPSTPPPPGRALVSTTPAAEHGEVSGLHRALNALRSALPFVQRLLPLLDGNVIGAVAGILAQQPQKPAPPVNLAPVQESISELQLQQRELQDRVAEQNVAIVKVEDQLQMVREATDRNTLEQQELMEDLKSVGHKVNMIALVALGLLAVSVLLNLVLYLHIQRVLP